MTPSLGLKANLLADGFRQSLKHLLMSQENLLVSQENLLMPKEDRLDL